MQPASPLGSSSGRQHLHTVTAFTRADLLASIGGLALLTVLTVGAARPGGHQQIAVCQDNLRQLLQGWQQYADANNGTLVGNLDGGQVMTPANSNQTWVLGWLDINGGNSFPASFGGNANTNTFVLTQASPLAPYLGRRASVFKCPADRSRAVGLRGQPRVRSYSMNSYVGRTAHAWSPGYRVYRNLSDIVDPSPLGLLVLLDERSESINDGKLFIAMTGYSPPAPPDYQILDFPSMYHDGGASVAFADGHTEVRRWQDPRTVPAERPGQNIALHVASPGNVDVQWLQSHASRRESSF